MAARVGVDLGEVRLAAGDVSGAQMRRSGVSRPVTDYLANKSLTDKSMLFSAVIKLWESIRGIDEVQMARLAELSSCADVDGAADLIRATTNLSGILIDRDSLWALAEENFPTFGMLNFGIQRYFGEPTTDYFALPTNINDVVEIRQNIDQAVSIFNAARLALERDEHPVQCAFLSDNPVVLRSHSAWLTTDPSLVAENSEQLEYIQKALNIRMGLDAQDDAERPQDLESLIRASKEEVKLRQLVSDDLVFQNFSLQYAPIVSAVELTLHLVSRDWGEGSEIVAETRRTVRFEVPVTVATHCLVVTKPDEEGVVMTRPDHPKEEIFAYQDLHFDRGDFVLEKKGGALIGVEDLIASLPEGQREQAT